MTNMAKHQLAGLAALDSMLQIAMRALVQSYVELHREPRPTDSAESLSAAKLVDLCGRLLAAIDAHSKLVARRLPNEERRWPF